MNAPRFSAGRLRIGLAVAATLLASACAAGQQAQTANEKPTIDGVDANAGGIALRALAIEAPQSTSYAPGSNAPLIGVFVNNTARPDKLMSITSPAFANWSVASSASATSAQSSGGQSVPINPGSRASFGTPESQKVLLLSGLKQRLYPGYPVRITFVFQRGGSVTAVVPVALPNHPAGQTVPDTGVPTNG